MAEQFLFRGCDKLVYFTVAESVGTDGTKTITFGTPKPIAAVKEVGITTSSSSASHFGDNKPLVITNSEGADEITFSVFGIAPDVLADLTGKTFTEAKGLYVNNERTFSYLGCAWREKLTTGKYRYHVAYKGTFNIPGLTVATEDDGTEANGQDLTFTSIMTEMVFNDGKASKGYFLDTTYGEVDADTFFATIKSQDEATVTAKTGA